MHVNARDPAEHGFRKLDCDWCDGTGQVDTAKLDAWDAGERMLKDRIARGLTLRQEAIRLGVSVLDLSRRERGK